MALLVVIAMTATVGAEPSAKLDPNDTARLDEMVKALEQLTGAIYAARGSCAEIAQAIRARTPSDNKVFSAVKSAMQGPNAKALEDYTAKTYEARLRRMGDKLRRGSLYCRADKAVAAAWKDDELAIAAIGELPADEPAKPRKKPVPAGYEAKLAKYDVALAEYLAIGDKFDGVDNQTDCNDRAKLIPQFAAAHNKQDAAFEALDKAMQDAVVEDQPRMFRQSSPYIIFMDARGRCSENKAFVKAAKAAKLDGSKK
jgi:hypothetical protein